MSLLSPLKTLLNRCLTEPDVNSRLVFLIHGTATGLATLLLVAFFIHAPVDKQASYPTMLLALGSSGGIAAAGRFLTKKGSS